MNRCSPVTMRKALVIVNELKAQGIEFVALPVVSNDDREYLTGELQRRLDVLIEESEQESREKSGNMHENDVVEHYRLKYHPERVAVIRKKKGRVWVGIIDGNGTKRSEYGELDPFPNCESGELVLLKVL